MVCSTKLWAFRDHVLSLGWLNASPYFWTTCITGMVMVLAMRFVLVTDRWWLFVNYWCITDDGVQVHLHSSPLIYQWPCAQESIRLLWSYTVTLLRIVVLYCLFCSNRVTFGVNYQVFGYERIGRIRRPVTRGSRSGRTTPRLSAKGPLSQVKESIRACNKIKISFRLTQSLLPNEVADSVRFQIWKESET